MKEEIKKSNEHRQHMDETDQLQQDAIEAMSSRIDALTWVLCVFMFIFASSIIMILADKYK